MDDFITFDQMLEDLKERDENTRMNIETSQRTVEIINKITRAREKLGLSQRELAEKCHIKQPALARIETCSVIPKITTLIKIATAVGVDIEAISKEEKTNLKLSISQAIVGNTIYNITNNAINPRGNYQWKLK